MALKMAQGDDTLKRPQWHAQNAVCTSDWCIAAAAARESALG